MADQEFLEKLAKAFGVRPELPPKGIAWAIEETLTNPVSSFAESLIIEGIPAAPGNQKPDEFIAKLVEFLSGIPHAFIGGLAARAHGAREHGTKDYDILIDRKDLKNFAKFLMSEGGDLISSVEAMYTFYFKDYRFEVELRAADSKLDQAALANAHSAHLKQFPGKTLKVASPAYMAAMKVKAYSERQAEKDYKDFIGYLAYRTDEAEVKNILEKIRPDLLPVFNNMVQRR